MALSKLNLQQLRDVCQEEDIDHSGLHRQKDLIERINEVREARQATVEDDDVENYYLESKQITEFQSLCDDMLLEQFISVLPGEVGVFVDQRNVSSTTEMAQLADLFYESNKDENKKIDARRHFYSRGNQPFKPKISRC